MGLFREHSVASSTLVVVVAACFGLPFASGTCSLKYRGEDAPPLHSAADIKECLDGLTIDANSAYHTIAHLQHGLGNYYSFTDIAADSQASVQDTETCKLTVHSVKDDLISELENMKTDVVKEFGVSDYEELLGESMATQTIPSFPFHMRIVEIFRRLFDGNTIYVPPWASVIPFWVLNKREKLSITRSGENMMVKLGGKTVVKMGGLDAWEFIKQEANERVSGIKSLGGRVNRYIQTWNSFLFPGVQFVHFDPILVEFEDSSESLSFEGMVSLESDLDQQTFQEKAGANPQWSSLQKWLDAYADVKPTDATAVLNSIAQDMRALDEPKRVDLKVKVLSKPTKSEADKSLKTDREFLARRLAEAELVGSWPKDEPMFAGYWLPDSKTAVLKMTRFDLPVHNPDEKVAHEAIEELFSLHGRLVSKGGKRLLIDLSGNAGGWPDFANVLTQMVAPHLETQTELASHYAVRIGEFWHDWLTSFSGTERSKRAHVLRQDVIDEEEVTQTATRLLNLYTLEDKLGKVPLTNRAKTELQRIAKGSAGADIFMAEEMEKKNARDLAKGIDGDFFEKTLTGKHKQGWFPFTDDVKDPETGSAFKPALQPYLKQTETHNWGGKEDTYSQKYIYSCELPWKKKLGCTDGRKHQWPELAILTDGTCEDSCALVASKLQFAAGAMVFSYGGVPGEVMDTGASAGGDVREWDQVWKTTFYAALIGDAIMGKDSKIGQRLRQEKADKRQYSRTLPLPMPTTADVSFNFNMMFVPEMGKNALPREWYVIPAHRHYDVWDFVDNNEWDTWGDVHDLYSTIAGEDWNAIRLAGAGGKDTEAFKCAKPPPELTWKPKCGGDSSGGNSGTDDSSKDHSDSSKDDSSKDGSKKDSSSKDDKDDPSKDGSKKDGSSKDGSNKEDSNMDESGVGGNNTQEKKVPPALKYIFWFIVCFCLCGGFLLIVMMVMRRVVPQPDGQAQGQPGPQPQAGNGVELQTLANAQ